MRYEIPFNKDSVHELEKSIDQGPIQENGKHLLVERTIGKIGGISVCIFSDEHPPPHFCVKFQGKSNSFSILDCTPLYGEALKPYFRNIRNWHIEHKSELIKVWNESRPSDCSVGKI